jgi:hypothetical protein
VLPKSGDVQLRLRGPPRPAQQRAGQPAEPDVSVNVSVSASSVGTLAAVVTEATQPRYSINNQVSAVTHTSHRGAQ